VYLTIDRVADRHYGNYSLQARNMVGSAMTTVMLSRGVTEPGDARARQQQRDAHAVAADDADVFRSHQVPSAAQQHGQYLDSNAVRTTKWNWNKTPK